MSIGTGRHRVASALGRRSAAHNLVAQGGALAVVSLMSLLIGRHAGPAVLGEYTLLRVLPWLTGVVFSCGVPVASAYFLAGERKSDPRLRPTLAVLVAAGAALALAVWLALTPLLRHLLFAAVPMWLLVLSGLLVVTQLVTVWGKACCQGEADMFGSNMLIVGEELLVLPCYLFAVLIGVNGIEGVVFGMLGGGLLASTTALIRLTHNGFTQGWRRPSAQLASEVTRYGARGQLGNLLWLVNLRLDFVILGALAGPAVLGVYAVASKFAELMRLPATALNYVLYPRFARASAETAGQEANRLLPRAAAVTIAMTPILAIASVYLLPLLYGKAFQGAVLPSCILLGGLAVEGAAAVASAYLCGTGRPGANSWGMGVGVVVTITLDILLIPGHQAVGAAVASTAAYLVTTGLLTTLTRIMTARTARPATPVEAT
ncbi:MAG TPA: oligosaccharide flippase family protein [Pseudonocardiaceae bacterium]|nr:oligosaccharide flippase family protein [Pseudonocardiaceae bacterium]